ncbi:MAG: CPBP family glutamic-type intramembrane protease [Bacteroidia bacterium]|nr:CPBP family glutamic-type intramembrane protease [Bacteroidia bacterium]
MNYTKIFQYLLLAFGLSFLGVLIPSFFMDPEGMETLMLQVFLYSWGPAAAAYIVQKYIYKGSFARYGYNRKRFNFSWIFKSILAPLGVVIGTLVIVFMMGNLMGLPGFGQVVLGNEANYSEDSFVLFSMFNHGVLAPQSVEAVFGLLNGIMLPEEVWTLLIIVLLVGIVAGASFNLFFNVGEEIGWRGFMVTETKSLGFLGSNLVTGVLYGLWQLPMLLFFIPEWDTEVMWLAWTTVGFAISISFPLAYFSLKTRSVYAPATFVGVLNNVSVIPMFFLIGGNMYLSSVKGLAGMIVLMAFTYFILRYDKKFIEDYQDLEY